MAKKLTRGIFITFEGPEGSGKSTHSKRLAGELISKGYKVLHTAEPGGTPLGKKIREILLDKDDIRLCQTAELFLFEADRAQHIADVIKPALESGKVVISDRFNTATFAYQGYGLGMPHEFIETIDGFSRCGISPDLVILLDVDVATGLSRAIGHSGADRMEKRDKTFHNKVRKGYISLAKKYPTKIRRIDASGDLDAIYAKVKREVYGLIQGR